MSREIQIVKISRTIFQAAEEEGEGCRIAEVLFLAAVDGETRTCQVRVCILAGLSIHQGRR